MQRSQRFVADQRFDLPQYNSMIGYISAEFNKYNRSFLTPLNKVVKNWEIVSDGGLQVKVNQATDSLLVNSQRSGKEIMILRKFSDDALTLTLADNATNYVEVEIVSATCATDTVAIWDTTANGGQGEEFTQSSDTVDEQRPLLQSNTIAFTGSSNRLPLAVVVTSGGVISTITDARNVLFNLVTNWDFGSPRTDKTISNIKEMYDAITTSIKEMKGTASWYTFPFGYTSLTNIAASDDFKTAISKLDAAINAIQLDLPVEEHFLVVGSQTVFTTSTLTWNVLNTEPDIMVFVNGQKVKQSSTGLAAGGDFKKNANNIIEFFNPVPDQSSVTIRKENQGGGGGGGGSDLTNITVNPQPVTNAAHSLGTTGKAWSALYLKDTTSSQVYKLEVISGALTVTAVP